MLLRDCFANCHFCHHPWRICFNCVGRPEFSSSCQRGRSCSCCVDMLHYYDIWHKVMVHNRVNCYHCSTFFYHRGVRKPTLFESRSGVCHSKSGWGKLASGMWWPWPYWNLWTVSRSWNGPVVLFSSIAFLDTVTIGLVFWKILTESTTIWSTMTKSTTGKHPNQQQSSAALASNQLTMYKRAVRFVRQHPTKTLLHSLTTLTILTFIGLELYFFNEVFTDGLVDFKGWGFGQIVGITIWISVFTELAYLEWSQPYPSLPYTWDRLILADGPAKGLAWRFPPWLRISTPGTNWKLQSTTTPKFVHESAQMRRSSTEQNLRSASDLAKYTAVQSYEANPWCQGPVMKGFRHCMLLLRPCETRIQVEDFRTGRKGRGQICFSAWGNITIGWAFCYGAEGRLCCVSQYIVLSTT